MSPPPLQSPLPLPEGEVHVWFAEPGEVTDPRYVDAYLRLLDAQERDKYRRFHFERHRWLYLVSHALVRVTLSRYAPVAPEAWSFVTNEYGRPEVLGERLPRLRFNLSHTEGMALLAVTVDADLGADVEDTGRPGRMVDLADSFFAPEEVSALRARPEPLQRERFFEFWTLKEAYIKARGAGLSIPLRDFAFHLSPGQPPRISFDPRLADTPEAWSFVQLRPSARHLAALAVRQPGGRPLSVRCWRTMPLEREEPVPLF